MLPYRLEPHLDLTKNQLLFVSIQRQFFFPPLNFSVSTCPHYPNDEDLNIWEESEADKLPIGEHQVRRQIYVGIVHSATTIHNSYVTGRIDLF